jgi:hypothetical protein
MKKIIVDETETVILDAKEYEKITHAFNLLKLLVPAEEDISAGRYKEAKDFFKKFKHGEFIQGNQPSSMG